MKGRTYLIPDGGKQCQLLAERVRALSLEPWLVRASKVFSGGGADIVMESITLTTPRPHSNRPSLPLEHIGPPRESVIIEEMAVPENISPISLICPVCGAKPDRTCVVFTDQREAVHIERVAAAETKDLKRERRQEKKRSAETVQCRWSTSPR